MKLLVLFLQYDTGKYSGAYERMRNCLSRIKGVDWIIFCIDNRTAFTGVMPTEPNVYVLGGDNSSWEFSGWQVGLEQAKKIAPDYDGVLFINDAFEVSGPSFLSKLSSRYIKLMFTLNIPIGAIDTTGRIEGCLLGHPFERWVRSNCFLLNKHCVESIKITSIAASDIDLFIDTRFRGAYFREDAPLSPSLQEHIVSWLSMYWHSAFCLEDNWDLFRNKTRAILNEFLLGRQIIQNSRCVFDHRLFLYYSISYILRLLSKAIIRYPKEKFKKSIKAIIPQVAIRRLKEFAAFFWEKIEYRQAQYILSKIRSSTRPKVVLLEPNETHAEVLPGFAQYFLQAGYDVHVALRRGMAGELPFCRMVEDENLHLYACGRFCTHFLFDLLDNDTDLVILATSLEYAPQKHDFLEKHKDLHRTKCGTVVVLHDIEDYSSPAMQHLLACRRIITLGRFSALQRSFPVVPLYFGPVAKHKMDDRKHFIVVGASEKNRRDYPLLFRAGRSLLRSGKRNFLVTLAGINYGLYVPDELKEHIVIYGRLSFPALYDLLEKSDFIIPLLNEFNADHLSYITRRVSGTRQLMFGFAKPCLINAAFAEAFSIDAEHSLFYEKNGLSCAMKLAISMEMEEYDQRVNALLSRSASIYAESTEAVGALLNHVGAKQGNNNYQASSIKL